MHATIQISGLVHVHSDFCLFYLFIFSMNDALCNKGISWKMLDLDCLLPHCLLPHFYIQSLFCIVVLCFLSVFSCPLIKGDSLIMITHNNWTIIYYNWLNHTDSKCLKLSIHIWQVHYTEPKLLSLQLVGTRLWTETFLTYCLQIHSDWPRLSTNTS